MDRIIKKKRWTIRNIIILSSGVLFITFCFYFLFIADHSSRLITQKERLNISTVRNEAFQEFIPIVGTVIPIKTAYMDALEGGMVNEIFLEAGIMVEKGDTIFQLENTNLRLDIMRQQTTLLDQRNVLENTKLDMERQRLVLKDRLIDFNYNIERSKRTYEQNRDLFENKIVSRHEFEESKGTYEYYIKKRDLAIESSRQDSLALSIHIQQLSGSLKRLQNNLSIVKTRMDHLTIKAPVSGQLTSLNVEYSGEIINSGERLGQIDILDGFKIRAAVDEHYLSRINVNQRGVFELTGQAYTLLIKKIFPEIVDGRFNIDFEFLETSPSHIRRGQTVHIRLELGNLDNAVVISRGGFYQKTGGQWIFVINSSGNLAEKRTIQLGRQNSENYEVLSGLEPGERVIVSSYDNFGDVEKLVLK